MSFDKAASDGSFAALASLLFAGGTVMKHHAIQSVHKEVDGYLTSKTRDMQLTRRLKADIPKDLKIVHKKHERTGSYDLEHDKVHVGDEVHPAILAHELGHAELARADAWPIIQNRVTVSLANASNPVTGVLFGSSREGAVAAIPAIAKVPQLIYEATASTKGLERLERAGASPEEMEKARSLLRRAFMSYAGEAAQTVGASISAHSLRKLLLPPGTPCVAR